MRLVADGDAGEVDGGRQLLCDLRQDVGKRGIGIDREPELALFTDESENHGACTALSS